MQEINFGSLREQMVKRLIDRGVNNKDVLTAMGEVPREHFVPAGLWPFSYDDTPLPLGQKHIIAHPWIIAFILQVLDIKRNETVLELGTGSGYQTAIVSRLAGRVLTVESSLEMALTASLRLRGSLKNVRVYRGNSNEGFDECAPYDVIIGNTPFLEFPKALTEQLKDGGRLVFSLRTDSCEYLILARRAAGDVSVEKLLKLDYVPISHALDKVSEGGNQEPDQGRKKGRRHKPDKGSDPDNHPADGEN